MKLMGMDEKSRPKLKADTGKIIAAAVAALFLLASVSFLFDSNNDDHETVLGADQTFQITGSMTVNAIETAIQKRIDDASASGGGNVTVTGSRTFYVNVGTPLKSLELTIPANTTVIWKAVYKGTAPDSLIDLRGNGTFIADKGADISGNTADTIRAYEDDVHVIVSGGIVENTLSVGGVGGDAIHYGSGGVTVTDGIVRSISVNDQGALYGNGKDLNYILGDVLITGGRIESTGPNGIAIFCLIGNVHITGGTVEATGNNGIAIRSEKGTVGITGGKVEAKDKNAYALYLDDGLAVYLNGTVESGKCIARTYGGVFEIQSLDIESSWDGTSEGLLITSLTAGFGLKDVKWDLSNNNKTIVCDKYRLVLTGHEVKKLSGDPSDGNIIVYILILIIAIVLIMAVVIYLKRKKK
jgi:hypothetical protein